MQDVLWLTGRTKPTILNQTQTYLLPMDLWDGIFKNLSGRDLETAFYKKLQKTASKNLKNS